jgi:signal transduction histidine kinase
MKKQKQPLRSSSFKPQFGTYDTLIKYTILPSIPLSIIAILSLNLNTWVLSEIHHFYIELFAVILAAILSFYYIARAYTLNDKFSLFIGVGFLANALIDLLHVIVSYTFMDEFLFLKYFIPQTWFAGRMFLSAMFAIAIAGYPVLSSARRSMKASSTSLTSSMSSDQQEAELSSSAKYSTPYTPYIQEDKQKQEKIPKILVASLVILTILSAFVAISSLYIIYPGFVIDNFPLHRPYEIPPLTLFLVALFYFYKNQLYKKSDVFYKGILVALIIDIFGQIIMSYSATSFDTAHNVAHVLKDAGYFVNIIGLALSSIQYNTKLRESNRSLIESNARLKEREEVIRIQYEKLKETDKMKDEFINVAAHELRTPIQPILGLTVFLKSKIKDNKQSELLDVTIRNAKRLQRLTENILDVTRLESQSLKLNKEKFDINKKILNVIKDIEKQISDSNKLKILFVEPRDAIFVDADKMRIYQVIANLLYNAIKFTKEGTISVSVKVTQKKGGKNKEEEKEEEGRDYVSSSNSPRHVIVSVKDSGAGIDPEIMPRLFTKFVTKSDKGTGLGLFISKSIIESHGGKIWAENNSDGKGATFTFSLPID